MFYAKIIIIIGSCAIWWCDIAPPRLLPKYLEKTMYKTASRALGQEMTWVNLWNPKGPNMSRGGRFNTKSNMIMHDITRWGNGNIH